MHIAAFVFAVGASLLILPILVAGAVSDYKTRTFPKDYWNNRLAKFAIIFTSGMYVSLMISQDIVLIITYAITSVTFSVIFLFFAYRYGSGGDYRALWYIALISPALIVVTAVLAVAFGIINVITEFILHGTEGFEKVPWAVSILAAYVIAFAYVYIL